MTIRSLKIYKMKAKIKLSSKKFSDLSLKMKIKRISFISLIILFLPLAIFSLIKQDFGLFFEASLVIYIIIQILNKILVE